MQGGWGDVGGAQPPRPIAPAPGALRAPAPIPPAQPQAQPQQTWPQAQPQQTWGQPQHQPQHQPQQQQQQQQQQARSQAQSEYKHTPEELKQWEDYYRSLGQTWTPTPVQQQQAAANAAARSSAAQPPAAQPRAAHPPAATQTQPAANQPANGVGPESDDMKKLHKTIKFLVASQLSKFLSLPQYFDNNQEELLKCCRHIVPKVYDVEKKKDPEGYKSRKMQQGVLAYVNAYMEKYHRRKDEKVRDLRATRPGGARDRKRKRYGDIDLAGTPHVDALSDDDMDNDLFPNAKAAKVSQSVSASQRSAQGSTGTQAASASKSPKREFGTQADTPGGFGTPSQLPAFSGLDAIYSSQPPVTRSGTRVDHGFEEDNADPTTPTDPDAKLDTAPPPDMTTL